MRARLGDLSDVDFHMLFAARNHDFDGVAREIGRGADPRVESVEEGSALTTALDAAQGYLDCVFPSSSEAIIELSRGCDVNAAGAIGRTALMFAAKRGALAMAREFMAAGADPRAVDDEGFTALMHACRAGEGAWPVAELLLEVGSPKAANRDGCTAMMLVAMGDDPSRSSAAWIRRLLAVSDPMAVDEHGRSALWHAAASCDEEAVEALLPVSNPIQVDGRGNSALMAALARKASGGEGVERKIATALSLVGHCDLLAVGEGGRTALMWARIGGFPQVAAAIQSRIEAMEIGAAVEGGAQRVGSRPRI